MQNRLVIVTGALGALGSKTCDVLQKAGWIVAGIDVAGTGADTGTLDDFVGGTDLSDAAATRQAIEDIAGRHGPLAALVNIAGGFAWETVEDGSPDTWDMLWSRNVRTCLNACRAALPLFAGEGGAIVNIGAAATARAAAGMGAYTASKSGVSRLTEALAEELKPRAIRVNALLPTMIDTPANRADMPDADFSQWVRPEELANIIDFLIRDKASALNGALIPVVGRM